MNLAIETSTLSQTRNIHGDIIDLCKEGNAQAQRELYTLYSKAMFNICFRYLKNQEAAEDVLQEAFISAFKYITSFRGEASFGAWLKRIVVNTALNQLKKDKDKWLSLDDEMDIPDETHAGWSEDNMVLEVDRIKEALLQLPDGYRVVFSMYLLEGYDHNEIAEVLNISVSTSKSQFNRAKNKLREILKSEYYG